MLPARPHFQLKRLLIGALFVFSGTRPQMILGQSLQEIRIGSTNIAATNFCTFYARDRHFFQREGLDAKIVIVRTEVGLTALSAGNLDYSTLSTSSIEATMKGMPLRVVAITNRYPLLGLVVPPGMKEVGDLKGKKLAISSFGGAVYSAALELVKHHNFKPQQDVVLLASGANVARIAALKQKYVDAAIISSPDDLRVAREGFKILMDVGTLYRLPFGGISTSLSKIRDNPRQVERVVRAVIQATKAITEPRNKADVLNYIETFFKLDRQIADEFYARLLPSLNPPGTVDHDKIKLVIDSALEREPTSKPLDPEAVIDFSFANKVGS